jgi:putative peptidoglycan lipid II flippase
VGEEVPATSDVLTPETPEAPDTPEVTSEDSSRAFVRNTTVMSVGTSLSRLTGFVRLAALTYALGVTESRLADAYNVANTTPNIIYELALGGILSSVFVPVFVEWLQERGPDEAWDIARRIFTLALVVLTAITIVGIVFAPWIVRLYTLQPFPGRETERELATFFLRWFMPQILFYGIGAIASGLLNAHRRFAAPMFAPITNNLIVTATFVVYAAMPGPGAGSRALATGAQELVLAIGTTLGVAGMTIALWPAIRSIGFRFRWRMGFRHPAVMQLGRLARWVVVYVVANQLGYLVIPILATPVKGGYTAYVAAFILFQLPHAIFAVSIFTALLPAMSSRWTADDPDGFRLLLSRGIRATAAILLPAALGYIAIGHEIVRLLLQHGIAGAASARLVASILAFFAIGLFPFSLFQLLLRAFYAMQDTRTPALINIAAVSLNTAVNFLYFFGFGLGVRGLALGHATAYTFASITSLIVLRRKLGRLDGRRVWSGVGRSAIAALATGAAAWVVARVVGSLVDPSSLLGAAVQVFLSIAAGLLVFAAAALILRIEEVDTVKRQLAARWRR